MKKLFTLLALSLSSLAAFSQSTTVVISQVFGGGGGSTGTYKYDYVELYNLSAVSQDISGFQIQYGSATGIFASSASNNYVIPASTVIPAGKYLLIQCGTAGTAGAELPAIPDLVTTNLAMSGTNGKVALVTSAAAINTCGSAAAACTVTQFANFIDWVAYGAAGNGTAGNGEGGTSVNNGVALTSSQGAVRKNNGSTDTDNNNADFTVVTAPVPRNLSGLLPVTLKSITGSLINNQPQVNWETSNETNFDYFGVEKSFDAKNFAEIARVASNKASNGSAYQYADINKTLSTQFYRLKMVDNDGTFKYSSVVAVNGKPSLSLALYPNPVTNTIILSHPKAIAGAAVKVVGIDGKILSTQNVQTGATQTSIDATRLVKGNYVVSFVNDGVSSTTQLVKQ